MAGISIVTRLLSGRPLRPTGQSLAHNEDDWGDNIVNVRGFRRAITAGRGMSPSAGEPITGRTAGRRDSSGSRWPPGILRQRQRAWSRPRLGQLSDRKRRAIPTDGGIGYMLRRIVAGGADGSGSGGPGRRAYRTIRLPGFQSHLCRRRQEREPGCWPPSGDAAGSPSGFPDDEVAILPNHHDDPPGGLGRFRPLPGLRRSCVLCQARGWYDPEKDGPFDFKKAYTRPSTDLLADLLPFATGGGLSC